MVLVLSACGEDRTQPTELVPSQTPPPTVDELSTLIAMQQVATEVPTATPWPTPTPTLSPTPATPTPTPTFQFYPTNTPRATQHTNSGTTSIALGNPTEAGPEHYWFARPFPRDASGEIKDYASRSYPYGSTSYGQFQTHHGVDISNSPGTSILAVANGWVVFAGSDDREMFGPETNFYGKLVVIEHEYPAPNGEMLYTLYGHMSEVTVEAGQHVMQGDKIGEVGSTGVALGPHLHLEVRLGDYHDYYRTYNPDLWVRPWPTYGTLAGTLKDRNGNLVKDTEITIQPADGNGGETYYTFSYADNLVNPDPILGENYVRGDLPEGDYKVYVRIQGVLRYQGEVTVEAGKTAWLDIVLR